MRYVITAVTNGISAKLYDSAYDDYIMSKAEHTEALNEAVTLDIKLPPQSLSYAYMDDIIPLKTLIEVRQDSDLLFRGRAFRPYEGFYKEKGLVCEGELAFFKDSVIFPGTYIGALPELFTVVVDRHNSVVEPFKRFAVGAVTVGVDEDQPLTIKEASSCSAVLGALISAYGGYLSFGDGPRGRVINWLNEADFGRADQPIELGQNLMDYSLRLDASEFANRIYAYGAETNGTRIALPEPGYMEDASSVQMYGTVAKALTFNDVSTAPELTMRTLRALNEARSIIKTISVSAIDLSRAADQRAHPELSTYFSWKIGQLVRIVSTAHGVDAWYRLTARSVDLLDPSSDRITLGGSPVTLTGELSHMEV